MSDKNINDEILTEALKDLMHLQVTVSSLIEDHHLTTRLKVRNTFRDILENIRLARHNLKQNTEPLD